MYICHYLLMDAMKFVRRDNYLISKHYYCFHVAVHEIAGTSVPRLLDLWNEWATQFLVVFSLAQQVLLLLFSGIRRHKGGGIRRVLLWLAYQLADSTATYALGNLSLSSSMREHRLAAFWAPFLLLHLGGPDNITAYSLEDNKLWKRHLLSLVVQVLGAGYVLYMHFSGNSGTLFSMVAAVMTAIGVVKFWERTWALKRASFSIIRDSVKTKAPPKCLHDDPPQWGFIKGRADEEEFLMRRAHSLFHICKSAMVDSSVVADTDSDYHQRRVLQDFRNEDIKHMWTLMEMELSLMYDILYTKAAMVHTLSGYGIRVVSTLAVAASLLLFYFGSSKDGHNRVDVAVTYALLVGAFFMEMASLLSALSSTWTFAFLCSTRWSSLRHAALCSGRWKRLRHVVVALHRLAYVTGITDYFRLSRRWSGTIGQCNMLDMCVRWHHAAATPLLCRLARTLGSNMWTVDIPDNVKVFVVQYINSIIRKGDMNTLGVIRKHWGQAALKRWAAKNVVIDMFYLGAELQEAIIIWHIGTDIFLVRRGQLRTTDDDLVEAVKAISNYMMFLLVEQPGMLPGLAQKKLYERTERSLAREWSKAIETFKDGSSSWIKSIWTTVKESSGLRDARLQHREKLANSLHDMTPDMDKENPRLRFGINLAKKLLKMKAEDSLNLVFDVWTDILIYTSNRCSRESHAKKLNSGGELTTIIWLLTEHLHQGSDLLPYQ